MSITDELREYAGSFYLFRYKDVREKLDVIADRIDAEYQKVIRELNNLADTSVLLPIDADGVPIHLGDKVYQVKGGWVYTVKGISFYPDNTTVTFECEHGFGIDSAHNVRHYHEPTVEDVLRDVVTLCHNTWKEGSAFEFYDVDDVMESGNIAEFAAKLRLAENEDA